MREIRVLLMATFAVLGVSGMAAAQECLMSLNATAANATTSTDGKKVTAIADGSGSCTFTLTACVDDDTIAGCTVRNVTKVKLGSFGSGLDLSGLQGLLEGQLPATQRTCSQTTVNVPLHKRKRLPPGRGRSLISGRSTADTGRPDVDRLRLVCQCDPNAQPLTSTFQGIQKAIFENHGCTNALCHGSSAKQGGLDLSTAAAYQSLVEVHSSETELNRVQPGDKDRSYLWLKLAAATDPTLLPAGVQITGAPMPNGLAALTTDELEAVRLWIYSGAPRTGTVPGTEKLLNACLAPAEPIIIKPLDPPVVNTGVQLVMPPWPLEAHSEHEICFATYYDITKQVPVEFRDPSGTMFRFSANELRQDPQSHHLILNRYVGPTSDIHSPTLGAWTCNGGPTPGETCEPTTLSSCGEGGICTSEIKKSFACVGFGPQSGGSTFYAIGGAQKAQATSTFADGVFAQVPMKGILYWNSHAFNLTSQDTVLHARLNYYFANAQNQLYPVQSIFNVSQIFAAQTPPFTTGTICNNHVLPQGARLFSLSSHTHKRGKHFTVTGPTGSVLFENFVYNDPPSPIFNPPLAFDSSDPAQRTLRYCSLYNNGVAADGSADTTTVTRRSTTPQSALAPCAPVACATGQIGAACAGAGDDHTCDSALGANDGFCDACKITGGESTENEMFILIGSYYIAPNPPGGSSALHTLALDSSGRSMSTELALPPQLGCSSAHAGHTGTHASHLPH